MSPDSARPPTFAVRSYEVANRYYHRKASKTNTILARKALAHKLARASFFVMRDQKPFVQNDSSANDYDRRVSQRRGCSYDYSRYDWTRAGLQILPFDANAGARHFGLDTPSGASQSSVQIKWTRRRTDYVTGHLFRCRRHPRPTAPRELLDPDGWLVRIDF
jgi:hypothetical protein